ncbi:MAG TPA: glycosyltransferase [Solirubrobacteraceae bacterium]
MNVAVDARHLGAGRGVALYTSELLAALERLFPETAFLRRPRRARVAYASAALLGRPRLGGADVAWLPAPAPVAVGVPYVLTVHDVSWLERPGDFTPYERLWHRLGRLERLAERARVVVAVSETTRRAIAERWPRVGRVEVVHSGIPALPPPGPRPAWLPPRYVLFVGALEPRKAPGALLDARVEGVDVVFAGSGRLAPRLRGDGVHLVKDADRPTLATLYAHALALALPSHTEGFGFTALEAARAGVPVITTPLPVVEETLGEAALRTEDLRDAIARVASDDALRARLAAAGRERAARFDWDATARRMHALLAEAAGR